MRREKNGQEKIEYEEKARHGRWNHRGYFGLCSALRDFYLHLTTPVPADPQDNRVFLLDRRNSKVHVEKTGVPRTAEQKLGKSELQLVLQKKSAQLLETIKIETRHQQVAILNGLL